MEQKIIWEDYKVQWPKKTTIFFDAFEDINQLIQLVSLLHAESAEVRIKDKSQNAQVFYDHKTKRLVLKNCDLILEYSKRYSKIKIGGIIWQE